MKKLVALLFAVLVVLPIASLAQSTFPMDWWNPQGIATWLGLPSNWSNITDVLYRLIVPFFTAFVVIYGILLELRIFRTGAHAGRLNALIAFLFAFLLLPSGILTFIVNIFYAAGAFIGLAAFGALFIGGTILWAYGSGHRIYGDTMPAHIQARRTMNRRVDFINEEITNLREERAREQAAGHAVTRINNRIDSLETEREHLRDRLSGMEATAAPAGH